LNVGIILSFSIIEKTAKLIVVEGSLLWTGNLWTVWWMLFQINKFDYCYVCYEFFKGKKTRSELKASCSF
jgi:hypothetical protein